MAFDWFRNWTTYEPVIKPKSMRVAFVVGHTEKDKGAYSPHLKVSEWDFYNEVLSYIPSANIFHHDPNIGGYVTRVKKTAEKLNKVNFDLVICLHFNAAIPQANGCETLYYFQSRKGRDYAKKFSDLVTKRTGIKSRNGGLKALTNRRDRGFAAVYYPKAPVILIEPFFGSNESDCTKIQGAEKVAKIIQEFISII